MASFKFLEVLCSKILICLYIYIYMALKNLSIILANMWSSRSANINKFLAYKTKNKFHKLQK